MFKDLMAKIGIGATKVNLVLPGSSFRQGETVQAKIMVEPGKVEQKIDQIYIKLIMKSQYKKDDSVHVVTKTVMEKTVNESFTMTPGSSGREIPVELTIPLNIPITFGKTVYYFDSGLDVDAALDPSDKDSVTVMPSPELECLFKALDKLGFQHKNNSGVTSERRQEFEYRPTMFMRGKLDELEASFNLTPQQINVHMQIDKKSFGLLDMLDLDERNVGLTIPNNELQNVDRAAAMLEAFIEAEYKKI